METKDDMKKIMILGAGIYQVPLIKKAREMGLYTIVVSIKGNYPGFALADKVYYLDTTDAERILETARAEQIDGICTAGTDVAVPTIGKVCDALGLKGVSYEAALCSANKFEMKRRFVSGGVCTAVYQIAHNAKEAKEIIDTMGLPVMIKAVDSSGSRGITKIRQGTAEEITAAVNLALSVSKKDYFVVEECIEGTEFGAQALVNNGSVVFVMPHGDYVFQGDTGVPVGHYVPYDIAEDLLQESARQVELSVKALGLDNCALNADFILKDGKVYVLEVGARSGATCLPEMVSIYYGVDFYKMILQTAFGEKIDKISVRHGMPNACRLIMADRSGTITGIRLPETENRNIVDVSFDYGIGDHVNRFHIGPDRIGQVITKGNTLREAVELMDHVIDQTEISIKEDVSHGCHSS
ncbi:MAG: ATP-grasp domain-containing protein [Clostridiales bacterium]|nr:ATP-grasp domain-containing protein [Clostridiales bacterium]